MKRNRIIIAMKKTILSLWLMSIVGMCMAQEVPYSVIDVNNVRGMVLGTGNAYSNILGNDLTWEVPKGSGLSPLFQYALWVGGVDVNNQIHLAANLYNQNGRDYWMGPLNPDLGYTDEIMEMMFEHVWNLTRDQINEFKTCHGQPGYVVPEDIQSWPARGNVNWGFAAEMDLAPFVDVNGDGRYNPDDGDYPDILGDQCLYFIFNDNYAGHTETGGHGLRMEVQAMVYAYDAPENEYLNNTVFFHYDLINRSTFDYISTYVGVWNDWDIGFGGDDYVGCNARLGACYAYNALEQDASYGDNSPVQLCAILAGPYIDHDGLDNLGYSGDCDGFGEYYDYNFGNGVVDDKRFGLSKFLVQSNSNDSAMGDPTSAEEVYRLLRGKWKDGSPVIYGGDGYPGSTGIGPQCSFMFPGDSDPCNYGTDGEIPDGDYNLNGDYWTEVSACDLPGDRRGLAVMGPFTFAHEDVQPLDFALTTVWKTDSQSALDRVEDAVIAVKQKFTETLVAVSEQSGKTELFLRVYPNPTEDEVTIEADGHLTVLNTFGQQLLSRVVDGQTTLNLPAGLYFVRLQNEKGCRVSKLVVK